MSHKALTSLASARRLDVLWLRTQKVPKNQRTSQWLIGGTLIIAIGAFGRAAEE